MFAHTHEGTSRTEWPDGGSYLSQLVLVVEMWELITVEIKEYRNEQRS